jgi:hypothetical protein
MLQSSPDEQKFRKSAAALGLGRGKIHSIHDKNFG